MGINVIVNALKTTGRGFLLGLGFSIVTGLVYCFIWQYYITRAEEEMSKSFERTEIVASAKDLVLADVEEQKHDGATAIIGSVKNVGSKPARSVQLQANLFSHGKFVDQYSTYISGTIKPGESRYFKISCGCSNTPPAEHDSFKVEVVSGF